MKRAQQNIQPTVQAIFLGPNDGEKFSIIGGGVRVLIDGDASAGQCCMFDCPIPPGDGPPLHRHEREDELFYVLDGRFKFSVNGNVFIGETGTFAFAPRGSIHAFRNIGISVGKLLVTCTPAGLEVPFRAVQDPTPGSEKKKLTPEQVMEEFSKFGITFLGPPLDQE